MLRPSRRLALLVIGLLLFVIVTAFLYQLGMARLEGKPRTFWQAFEWAGETLSTTGYGADAKWSHPLMVILVVAVQFVGVFLVFLIIPIYLVPFLVRPSRRCCIASRTTTFRRWSSRPTRRRRAR